MSKNLLCIDSLSNVLPSLFFISTKLGGSDTYVIQLLMITLCERVDINLRVISFGFRCFSIRSATVTAPSRCFKQFPMSIKRGRIRTSNMAAITMASSVASCRTEFGSDRAVLMPCIAATHVAIIIYYKLFYIRLYFKCRQTQLYL